MLPYQDSKLPGLDHLIREWTDMDGAAPSKLEVVEAKECYGTSSRGALVASGTEADLEGENHGVCKSGGDGAGRD